MDGPCDETVYVGLIRFHSWFHINEPTCLLQGLHKYITKEHFKTFAILNAVLSFLWPEMTLIV